MMEGTEDGYKVSSNGGDTLNKGAHSTKPQVMNSYQDKAFEMFEQFYAHEGVKDYRSQISGVTSPRINESLRSSI